MRAIASSGSAPPWVAHRSTGGSTRRFIPPPSQHCPTSTAQESGGVPPKDTNRSAKRPAGAADSVTVVNIANATDCGVSMAMMDLTTLIETRPGVRSGKPCFIGTRIAVYDVLEYLASGMTTAEIVVDFPELTAEHVRAAIEFAALRERRLATA